MSFEPSGTGTDLNSTESQPNNVGHRIDAVAISTFTGPLPPPEILARYEKVLPGAAERLFADFEREAKHRRDIEHRIIHSEAFRQSVSAVFSGLIGLVGVAGGVWLVHEGRDVSGLATLATTLASLSASLLIYGRRRNSSKDQENE